MTRDEFDAVMLYLGAAIGKVTPGEQLDVYFNELGHLHYADFQEGVKRSLRGLQENFLPSIGVLYRHACDAAQGRIHERDRLGRVTHDNRVLGLLNGIGRLSRKDP